MPWKHLVIIVITYMHSLLESANLFNIADLMRQSVFNLYFYRSIKSKDLRPNKNLNAAATDYNVILLLRHFLTWVFWNYIRFRKKTLAFLYIKNYLHLFFLVCPWTIPLNKFQAQIQNVYVSVVKETAISGYLVDLNPLSVTMEMQQTWCVFFWFDLTETTVCASFHNAVNRTYSWFKLLITSPWQPSSLTYITISCFVYMSNIL